MGCGSSREEGQEAIFERSEPLLDFNCKGFECGGVQVAQVSVQGWRKTMEDVSLVQFGVSPRKETLALGVFDGHSGAEAAQFAQKNLLGHIKETEEWRRGDVGKGCIHGFMDVDVAMRKAGVQSGTTAVLALLSPDEIVVANCGDSRSVLSRGGRQLPMSVDHKPGRKAEKRRIIRSGGYLDETDPTNPRVVCDSLNMSIATSRALGDFEFKSNPLKQPEEQMISPVPELYTRERVPQDEFLILASDGVWDVMDNPGIVSFLQMEADALDQSAGDDDLSNGEEAKQADAEILGRAVLQRCLEFGSRDNMTIVLADLRQRRRRKANPVQQQQPLQPPGPPSRSSSVPSAGDGSVVVGVDADAGQDDGSGEETTSVTAAPSPTVAVDAAAAAAAVVCVEAVSVSAVKLEGNSNRNGGGGSAEPRAEPAGQEGGVHGDSSEPASIDTRNQGSEAVSAVGKADLGVPAAAGEKVAVEPPEPPGELTMRAQAQAHVPSGGVIFGGIGDSGGSSSSAGRAGAAAAAAGGDAVVGEALLKEERPGLLRLSESSVDGDDGVIGAA